MQVLSIQMVHKGSHCQVIPKEGIYSSKKAIQNLSITEQQVQGWINNPTNNFLREKRRNFKSWKSFRNAQKKAWVKLSSEQKIQFHAEDIAADSNAISFTVKYIN